MDPMNSTERIFFRLERDGYPIDVAGITIIEPSQQGPVPFETVKRSMARVATEVSYLRRRVSPAPLGIGEDHWVMVDAVDIDAHVRQVTCPAPGDERALLDLVLELTAAPLDRSRPLWEVWYVVGMAQGRSSLVLRGHHALTDGVGFMKLYSAVFHADEDIAPLEDSAPESAGDDLGYVEEHRAEREPGVIVRAAAEVPERLLVNTLTGVRIARTLVSGVPQVAAGLGRSLLGKAQALPAKTGEAADALRGEGTAAIPPLPRLPRLPRFIPSWTSHPPVTRFNRHVTDPTKSMAVASLPLADIEAARGAHPGSTVNDVILALTSGALRRYLEPLGEIPEQPLLTTCPVNVRSTPGRESSGGASSGGNAFTAIWVELPVQLDDPVERLAAVHAGSDRAKGHLRGSRASWGLLADVGDLLLPGVVSAAMEFAGSRAFQAFPPTLNLSVSTLRGPEPLFFHGRKVEHLYARIIICPPVHLFIHAITYDGLVEMGILSVKQLLPDPDRMAGLLRTELDALLARVQPVHDAAPPTRPRAAAQRHGSPRPARTHRPG